MKDLAINDEEHVSLCEALDRVLNKGAVVAGEITISVANVDLIYLGLQLVLKSIEASDGLGGSSFIERQSREALHENHL
ncbi:MAG: gas vesicle protein [Thermodesulfobacteriota bacterium]